MHEEETTHSRLFVILAISLIGLLVLGLLGIGGVFIIRQNLQQQAEITRPTPTLIAVVPRLTATATPSEPESTNTPAATPTNTPVVAGGNGTGSSRATPAAQVEGAPEDAAVEGAPAEEAAPEPTNTPFSIASLAGGDRGGSGSSAPAATVPDTGVGAMEAVFIGLALVSVFVLARRWRASL